MANQPNDAPAALTPTESAVAEEQRLAQGGGEMALGGGEMALTVGEAVLILREGAPQGDGYVVVGQHPDGRCYCDVEPGRNYPANAVLLGTGATRYESVVGTEHQARVLIDSCYVPNQWFGENLESPVPGAECAPPPED